MRAATDRHYRLTLTLALLIALAPMAMHAADSQSKANIAKPTLGGPANSAAALPDTATKIPAAPSKPALTTPVLPAQEFAQIQQMRDMKQIKEMGNAIRNSGIGAAPQGADIANPAGTGLSRPGNRFDQLGKTARGQNGNQPSGYGDPTGDVPTPDLPSNRDKGPRGASNFVPSGNLRDHAGGVAGQDSTRNQHGRVVGRQREQTEERDTGTRTTSETRMYQDGYTVRESWSQHRDGGSTHTTTRTDLDRNTIESVHVHKDNEGRVDKDIVTGPIDGTQDPNVVEGGGCNPITGMCTGKSAQDPNRVNPGRDGATPTATASRIQFDRRGLVGDPDMMQRNGGGTPRMIEPGNPMNQVNPPNPNDGR